MTLSQSSTESFLSVRSMLIPALLIRTSTRLNLFHRPIYELLGLLRIRDVGLYRDSLSTALGDLVDQLLGRLLAPGVVDDDFGPPTSQLLSYGPAQTPARAGNDDNGFFQSTHTILLFLLACETEFIDWRNQVQHWSKHRDGTRRLLLQVRSQKYPGAVQE